MKDRKNLEELIRSLGEAKREYHRLAFDEEHIPELGPPASPAQIAKLERLIGKPLPPSYRNFLELHNGWKDFSGGASLLAVEDHESEWVKEKIRYWSDLFEDDSKNPFAKGAIPILFGEDENHFVVLDAETVQEDGEMEFVDYDYTEEHQRFNDFTSFLKYDLKIAKQLIDNQRLGIPTDEEEG